MYLAGAAFLPSILSKLTGSPVILLTQKTGESGGVKVFTSGYTYYCAEDLTDKATCGRPNVECGTQREVYRSRASCSENCLRARRNNEKHTLHDVGADDGIGYAVGGFLGGKDYAHEKWKHTLGHPFGEPVKGREGGPYGTVGL